jgi:hypothetical protein
VALQIRKDQATIAVRLGEVRLQRNRPIMARQRFHEAPQGTQPRAKIAVRPRIVLAQAKRLADQRNPLLRSADLQRPDAGQVQHIEMVGLLSQDRIVYHSGFSKFSRLMQRARMSDLVVQGDPAAQLDFVAQEDLVALADLVVRGDLVVPVADYWLRRGDHRLRDETPLAGEIPVWS